MSVRPMISSKRKRVLHFLVAPGVAGEDSDAKNIRLRRIDKRKNGLHVRAAGARGILIDDDFALRLRVKRNGDKPCEE